MAPRVTKRKIVARERDLSTPVLDSLGLEKGSRVRFRMQDGQDWAYGKVTGDNQDGSLVLYEEKTGHARSFMPERIQIKKRGPRGGELWEPIGSN